MTAPPPAALPPLAGMPGIDLTDAAAVRLDAVSFFLAGFLLCAWLGQGCWALLRKDFPNLPRPTYGRAVAATAAWAAAFGLVLTMISGARELMTPGAWERAGWTYELTDEDAPTPADARARRAGGLAAVYGAWRESGDDLPAGLLTLPGRAPRTYRLVPGRTPADAGAVLAYEPDAFAAADGGADPLVLFVGGDVHQLPRDVLETLLAMEPRSAGGRLMRRGLRRWSSWRSSVSSVCFSLRCSRRGRRP